MTTHPLDLLVRRHVEPALREHGFERRKRVFTRTAGSGDRAHLIVDLERRKLGDGFFRFWFSPAMAPVPYVDWLSRHVPTGGRVLPPENSCLEMPAVPPPSRFYGGALPLTFNLGDPLKIDARWKLGFNIGDGEMAECGDAFAEAFARTALPHLEHFLDRANLLRHYLDPDPARPYVGSHVQGLVEALLMVDDSPRTEVEEYLCRVSAAETLGSDFVAWIRGRLDARDRSAGLNAGGSESHADRTDAGRVATDLRKRDDNDGA